MRGGIFLLIVLDVDIPVFVVGLFGYWIPEVIPILIELYVILNDLGVSNASAEFKNYLYAEYTDAEEGEEKLPFVLNS